jgi:hypothetical protein
LRTHRTGTSGSRERRCGNPKATQIEDPQNWNEWVEREKTGEEYDNKNLHMLRNGHTVGSVFCMVILVPLLDPQAGMWALHPKGSKSGTQPEQRRVKLKIDVNGGYLWKNVRRNWKS